MVIVIEDREIVVVGPSLATRTASQSTGSPTISVIIAVNTTVRTQNLPWSRPTNGM